MCSSDENGFDAPQKMQTKGGEIVGRVACIPDGQG
jgi:hypothetical protein